MPIAFLFTSPSHFFDVHFIDVQFRVIARMLHEDAKKIIRRRTSAIRRRRRLKMKQRNIQLKQQREQHNNLDDDYGTNKSNNNNNSSIKIRSSEIFINNILQSHKGTHFRVLSDGIYIFLLILSNAFYLT